jgi:hypothetical protein
MQSNGPNIFNPSATSEAEDWLVTMKLEGRLASHSYLHVVNAQIRIAKSEIWELLLEFLKTYESNEIESVDYVISFVDDHGGPGIELGFVTASGENLTVFCDYEVTGSENHQRVHRLHEFLNLWLQRKYRNKNISASVSDLTDTIRNIMIHRSASDMISVRYVISSN